MRLTRPARKSSSISPRKRGARGGQQAPPSPLEIEPLKLLNPQPVRAPGLRIELETVEQAISLLIGTSRENWLRFRDGHSRAHCF
jgi:hypothetical protein